MSAVIVEETPMKDRLQTIQDFLSEFIVPVPGIQTVLRELNIDSIAKLRIFANNHTHLDPVHLAKGELTRLELMMFLDFLNEIRDCK